MRLAFSSAVLGAVFMGCATPSTTPEDPASIRVDRFGYLPDANKVAVLTGHEWIQRPFVVRDVATDDVVLRRKARRWHGEGHAWWFDLSAVRRPGTYRIDADGLRSEPFRVANDVYQGAMVDEWLTLAEQILDGDAPIANRSAIHQLLTAYEEQPQPWAPDVLDVLLTALEDVIENDDCAADPVGAALLAHAAPIYAEDDPALGQWLLVEARMAWDRALLDGAADCPTLSPTERDAERLVAAAYLASTDRTYAYVASLVAHVDLVGFDDALWRLEHPHVADAVRWWMQAPGSNPQMVDILASHFDAQRADDPVLFGEDALDPYRSYLPETLETRPRTRANVGQANLDVVRLGLDAANHDVYTDRAAAALHYLHGGNPDGEMLLDGAGLSDRASYLALLAGLYTKP